MISPILNDVALVLGGFLMGIIISIIFVRDQREKKAEEIEAKYQKYRKKQRENK